MTRSQNEEEEESRPRRTSRRSNVNYNEATSGNDDNDDDDGGDVLMMGDSEQEEPTEEDDDEMQVDNEVEEEEEPPRARRRRSTRKTSATTTTTTTTTSQKQQPPRRTSSRSTKCTHSMAEPTVRDLLAMTTAISSSTPQQQQQHKSPARRHAQRRRSASSSDDDDDDDDEEEEDEPGSEDDDQASVESSSEPLKIQRILACRTETKRTWKDLCQNMNTSEMDHGSRWFQEETSSDDDVFEERFLIKWSDLSYLHASWESQDDLLEQIDTAKTYLSTFFRKSHHGVLLTAEERCDGDYYDPAYTEIERILEISAEDNALVLMKHDDDDGDKKKKKNKDNPDYEDGTGRQFLVKWQHLPYSEATYEFERDLILRDVEYLPHVEAYTQRATKRHKRAWLKAGREHVRRLQAVFGEDDSALGEQGRAKAVEKYQRELEEHVYKNGGQLRDYQAEGVAWMLANYVNGRSSILADEMGLGKTLQTAIFTNTLITQIRCGGPALVVVPLSTITHWYREFASWTDLNAIVYHGSAADRKLIRTYELAYERDRPQAGVSFNSLFLKKCGPKRFTKNDSPWMFDVLITTPETLVADDFVELTAIQWELLVVDEAHRLKNHNSKLAVNLRDSRFTFHHKLLLTGTPIQNSVEEFWSLLHVLDEEQFNDANAFMEQYGDMKSKESIDQLHEEIRPYILRRLKEDVEKSVPQKSETLIEVELTAQQKQWYRALYEKNVRFLHRNKKKALDGPGLNNLAMELRKCCNHLFLLNGVEEEIRRQQQGNLSEGDFLAKASGKLVLLDKLLPRLKEEGHRVLIFSQFKIMLDILEDYLNTRSMKFERIDGSITGNKRQQAIDRFQAPEVEGKELPFIMMLSTRAGGVGINLTAADTCIIFDSDFNPQNDLQAQARCHRIGQTKTVKVYRLLTRKTYEMQMFHMSSLKMGLDQAVLKGFESGSSSEGALSKDEVEKLLRHGAYDIFNEDKAGDAQAESNNFVQQDIDSILERRSRTVVHENTGSNSNAAGGTFSKARFTSGSKAADGDKSKGPSEDVDIEDPDFWKKMLGDAATMEDSQLESRPRQRTKANYSERDYQKRLEATLRLDYDSGSGSDSDASGDDEDIGEERSRWGGNQRTEWKRDDAEHLQKALAIYGYGIKSWDAFRSRLQLSKEYDPEEVKRMSWALVLSTIIDSAAEEVEHAKKKEERKKRKEELRTKGIKDGGVLADLDSRDVTTGKGKPEEVEKEFSKLWAAAAKWCGKALKDAIDFAKGHEPRDRDVIEQLSRPADEVETLSSDSIKSKFAQSVWPSLRGRGWTASISEDGDSETRYSYKGQEFPTIEAVLSSAHAQHPELSSVITTLLTSIESNRQKSADSLSRERESHLALSVTNVSLSSIETFLECYGPLQLLFARRKTSNNKFRLGKRLLTNCNYLFNAVGIVNEVGLKEDRTVDIERLETRLSIDKKATLPHPMWTTRHDAVLVYAVARHGWVESDKCCEAIEQDETVKWGAPFEKTASDQVDIPEESLVSAELLATANRAANFLNKHNSTLQETKGFNFNLVVRTYGLIREGTAGQSPSSDKWVVDSARLELSKNSNGADGQGLAELPTKKDLVKRAKYVLGRAAESGGKNESEKKPHKPSHNFAVLDQSQRCNVLLAEILRGIIKTPQSSKFLRVLCNAADIEARKQSETSPASLPSSSDRTAQSDARRIMEQVRLVRHNLSKGATQSKNLVRAMLGEEPSKPKKPGDSLFPKDKPPAPFRPTTKRISSKKGKNGASRNSRSSMPIGESAIARARKRLQEIYGNPRKLASLKKKNELLQLTEIETLILSLLCTHGMPVWKPDNESPADDTQRATNFIGADYRWKDLGRLLEQDAKSELQRTKGKFGRANKNHAADESKGDPSVSREKLVALLDLEKEVKQKDELVAQAVEYASEPDTLAKKAIMLVAKIRHQWALHPISHFTEHTAYNGLGCKVPTWQDGETTRWAKSLDLLDNGGRPLGFTAIDFVDDIPDDDKVKIQVSSILDVQACKEVYAQMALLTKLRSMAGTYSRTEMISKVVPAVKALLDCGSVWEKKPEWWLPGKSSCGDFECEHDKKLLSQLLLWGLTDKLLQTTLDAGNNDTKTSNLSKLDLQLRANQLVRELTVLVESDASLRRLDAIRKETTTRELLTDQANVQQKGLGSFLVKKKSHPVSQQQAEIIDLVESSSVDSNAEKRKQVESSVSSSPEKKHRTH